MSTHRAAHRSERAAPGDTGTTPGTAPARFDFDVLAQADHWDPVTTGVVLARLGPARAGAFFTAHEEPTARALLDRLLGQDDEPRIPVFEMVDARLATGEGDGYRYDDMAPDPEAWRRSLAALDDRATTTAPCRFHELDADAQMAVIEEIRLCDGCWCGFPAGHLFSLWMRYACDAFYSHPWAWNEIGFGGPAYPRGYANLGLDRRESWERPEADARDPIPWARRADDAKAAHAARVARIEVDGDFGPGPQRIGLAAADRRPPHPAHALRPTCDATTSATSSIW